MSTFFSKVSDTAKVATQIPLLSSVAAPVSWAADVASSVASIFGYSKKPNQQDTQPVLLGVPVGFCNSDTVDNSVVLANQRSNETQVLPGFAGSDIDEMSLKYLVSIPSYFTAVSWSTTDTAGTDLSTIQLTPTTFFNQTSLLSAGVTYGYETHTPISFFSKFFQYYRGSFKITFKIVKTEFHSGRLAITYRPQSPQNSAPSLANQTYLYREIVDLRDSNEVTLTFPYMSNTQWKNVYTQTGDPIYESAYGVFFVTVVNPLVAPTGASTSVQILMEVCAADDYELAFPRPFGRGSSYTAPTLAPRPFYAQMDDGIKAVVKEVGSSHVVGGDLSSSLYCHGETITSIKQLLLRYCTCNTSVLTGTSSVWDINPFAIGAAATSATGIKTPDLATDYYALFASCFAVARGSVRLAIFQSTGNDQRITSFLYYPSNPTDNEPTRNGSIGGSTSSSNCLS